MRGLLLIVLLSGCGSSGVAQVGPNASTQEEAFGVVWEGSFGMETQSRPSIRWIGNCPTNGDIQSPGICWGSTIKYATGDIELTWTGKVSTSNFSSALAFYRHWLVSGDIHPDAAEMTTERDNANAALVAVGL